MPRTGDGGAWFVLLPSDLEDVFGGYILLWHTSLDRGSLRPTPGRNPTNMPWWSFCFRPFLQNLLRSLANPSQEID